MQPVLIVASDPLLQRMLQTTLVVAGYDTIVTTDGLSALAQARVQQPALIVVDLQLPIVTGPMVIRMLRRIPTTRETPIVALSLQEGLPVAVLDIPKTEILIKPFAPDALLQVMTGFASPTGMPLLPSSSTGASTKPRWSRSRLSGSFCVRQSAAVSSSRLD
jgi:DNA-binding response OmpR family regulator